MPRISQLTAQTALTSDDLFVVVDAPGGSAATKKITQANVQAGLQGGVAYTWPASNGDAGDVLTTDGAGVLSWEAASAVETALNDLSDVVLGVVASGDLLRHNGTNWVNTNEQDITLNGGYF